MYPAGEISGALPKFFYVLLIKRKKGKFFKKHLQIIGRGCLWVHRPLEGQNALLILERSVGMILVLQTANVMADAKNCFYPNRVEITSGDELKAAVGYDHVCGEFKKNYRNIKIGRAHV